MISYMAIVEQSRLTTSWGRVGELWPAEPRPSPISVAVSSLRHRTRCGHIGRRLPAPVCMMVGRPESAVENECGSAINVASAGRWSASFILSATLTLLLDSVLTAFVVQTATTGANCEAPHVLQRFEDN